MVENILVITLKPFYSVVIKIYVIKKTLLIRISLAQQNNDSFVKTSPNVRVTQELQLQFALEINGMKSIRCGPPS